MKTFIKSIAPKLDSKSVDTLSAKLELAKQSPAFFNDIFLKCLLDYKLAVFFDNTISLEELIHQLRILVTQNHVEVTTLGDELIEYASTDSTLTSIGKYLKKDGYVLVDFDQDPKIYYLSAVPISTKSDLEKKAKELGVYVQFF